jgi:hypothetical protein
MKFEGLFCDALFIPCILAPVVIGFMVDKNAYRLSKGGIACKPKRRLADP